MSSSSIKRPPVERLMLAILLQLIMDYVAVMTNDQKKLNDMRRYGEFPLTFKKRGRISAKLKAKWLIREKEWMSFQQSLLYEDMVTWGAEMAQYLGITKKSEFIKKANDVTSIKEVISRFND